MRTLAPLLLMILIAASQATAGVVTIDAKVRVCSNPIFCQVQENGGSGVTVGTWRNAQGVDCNVVLTAAHVLHGNTKDGIPVQPPKCSVIALRVCGQFPAKLVAQWYDDSGRDLAIIIVPGAPLKIITPLGSAPYEGQEIRKAGFDYSGNGPSVRSYAGVVHELKKGNSQLKTTPSMASGFSGGPAVDMAGNVVGITTTTTRIMGNFNWRDTILEKLPGANLPPATPIKYTREKIEEPKETAQIPPKPREDTTPDEAPGVTSPESATTPEESEPSLKDKAKAAAVKGATGVSKTLDFAEKVANNPLAIAAILLLTGGGGAGGLAAFQKFSKARKLRKALLPLPSDQTAPEVPEPPVPKFPDGGVVQRPLHERDEKEAIELIRLGKLEGRSPLLDSFVGVTTQDLVEADMQSDRFSEDQKRYIRDLWSRISSRVEAAAPLSTGSDHSDDWRV